jgi:hypothetical protein
MMGYLISAIRRYWTYNITHRCWTGQYSGTHFIRNITQMYTNMTMTKVHTPIYI